MGRMAFAIKEGWKNRKRLTGFLTDRKKQIHSLLEITPEKLDLANIAILILDFDGVLAGHDINIPTPETLSWLTQLSSHIGEQRIAIFSNKPKPERIAFFSKHFPSIHFVQGVAKKPYPEGILEVANYRGVPPHRVVLVDDRLLTGMLATCLAYSQGWYFYPPVQNFRAHPIKEAYFAFLRGCERLFFS